MQKTILAISGSLRPHSSSHVIMNEAIARLEERHLIIIEPTIGELPHFDGREEDAPAIVQAFRQRVREADGVVICTPEYAFGIPGSLKNALDWTVSSGEFVGKPVALITASSSGEKGHNALLLVLQAISARVIIDATLLLPFVRTRVKNGIVSDADTRHQISEAMHALGDALEESGPHPL